MVTLTCSLTFHNGRTVTAVLTTETAGDERPVTYTGAADELPRRYERASHAQLRALFLRIHAEKGGTYASDLVGEYDAEE